MRHQKNRLLELHTWAQKKSIFIRQLLTNLIKDGKVTTTSKRAKVLKAEADSFFSKLMEITARNKEANDAKREVIRYVKSVIFSEAEGRKIVNTLLPKYVEAKAKSFVSDYKVWFRVWDAAPKIMVKLI